MVCVTDILCNFGILQSFFVVEGRGLLLRCSLYVIYAKQKVSDNTSRGAVDGISNMFVARAL